MSCDWTDLRACIDPACGAEPAHLYTKPSVMKITVGDDFGGGYDWAVDGNAPAFNDALFSDSGLTVAAAATTATITQLEVYTGEFANCDAGCWAACVLQDDSYVGSGCYPGSCSEGSDPEAPPTNTLLDTYSVSIDFDPTGLFPFTAAYAAMPVIDGVTHHDSTTIVVATVETDVGTTLYVFAGVTCF